MTREDILAQAIGGAVATVKMKVSHHVSEHDSQLCLRDDDDSFAYAAFENVISIEPPPKTDAETIAELRAENEALKARLAQERQWSLKDVAAAKALNAPPAVPNLIKSSIDAPEAPWMPPRLEGYTEWREGPPPLDTPDGGFQVFLGYGPSERLFGQFNCSRKAIAMLYQAAVAHCIKLQEPVNGK